MRFIHLIWRNLMRKPFRTILTVGSVFVAFLLYGVLMMVQAGFGVGVDLAGVDRLITKHKVSLIQTLPYSYAARIDNVDGVAGVTHGNWFNGIYQDPKNFFANIAVDPESWLAIHPEIVLTDKEREAWLANRQGAIVGRQLAERFEWEVGDRIPLDSPIYQLDEGWEFVIEGIYEAGDETYDETQFFFHWKYVDETPGWWQGEIGWYVVQISNPDNAPEVASRIDQAFANSSAETETSTEKAFVQAFANQYGNIKAIVTSILGVVFFTLLLVAGNTVAQSVRERINELAVLKTLGFTDGRVMRLVLAESMVIALVGGLAGLGIIALVARGEIDLQFLPVLFMPSWAMALGAVLIVVLGLVAGAFPAWQASRLKIIDALGRRA
ncbi:MAG: FtsX-like permease family protein [Acidobacteriota bacterium]